MGHAVAAVTLRLQQRQGLDIEATVIEYLGTRELLLVVDNCEHLVDAAARLVDQIVTRCPRGDRAGDQPGSARGGRRAPIGGAAAWPLRTPPRCSRTAPRPDARFRPRPRAGRRGGERSVGSSDGLPLAIELAAARIRVMSSLGRPRRLDRLRLLTVAAARAAYGSRALPRRSTGPTGCSPSQSRRCSSGCRSSRVGLISAAAHGVCGGDDSTEDDTLDLTHRPGGRVHGRGAQWR